MLPVSVLKTKALATGSQADRHFSVVIIAAHLVSGVATAVFVPVLAGTKNVLG